MAEQTPLLSRMYNLQRKRRRDELDILEEESAAGYCAGPSCPRARSLSAVANAQAQAVVLSGRTLRFCSPRCNGDFLKRYPLVECLCGETLFEVDAHLRESVMASDLIEWLCNECGPVAAGVRVVREAPRRLNLDRTPSRRLGNVG